MHATYKCMATCFLNSDFPDFSGAAMEEEKEIYTCPSLLTVPALKLRLWTTLKNCFDLWHSSLQAAAVFSHQEDEDKLC